MESGFDQSGDDYSHTEGNKSAWIWRGAQLQLGGRSAGRLAGWTVRPARQHRWSFSLPPAESAAWPQRTWKFQTVHEIEEFIVKPAFAHGGAEEGGEGGCCCLTLVSASTGCGGGEQRDGGERDVSGLLWLRTWMCCSGSLEGFTASQMF